MIKELLPAPFEKRKKWNNKLEYYLWKLEDVIAAEQTEDYLKMKEAYEKRKISANKAVKTKTDELLKKIDKAITEIKVERIPLKQLYNDAIESKEDWYYATGQDRFIDRKSLSQDTILRWELNYIRHNLTQYDEELFNYYGKTGIGIGYEKYKSAVMSKIYEIYPELQKKKKKDSSEIDIEEKQ